MDYLVLKAVHVTAVGLSGAGFAARGLGHFTGARWVASREARTLPHLVDTVLLGSALALAWRLHISPLSAPWLLAKIAGLCAYIGLGMVALRFARTRRARIGAWLAALLAFGYIVTVAISKDPRGPFAAEDSPLSTSSSSSSGNSSSSDSSKPSSRSRSRSRYSGGRPCMSVSLVDFIAESRNPLAWEG